MCTIKILCSAEFFLLIVDTQPCSMLTSFIGHNDYSGARASTLGIDDLEGYQVLGVGLQLRDVVSVIEFTVLKTSRMCQSVSNKCCLCFRMLHSKVIQEFHINSRAGYYRI